MSNGANVETTEVTPTFANLDEGLAAAKSAADGGDQVAALRILAKLRTDFPEQSAAYLRASALLVGQGRLDEAETLLSDARARFPKDFLIAIEHARAADRRRDTEQAIARWTEVKDQFPNHPAGHVNAGAALRGAGRFDEAEAILAVATERFPNDIGAAATYAQLAHARRQWLEALARWEQMRTRFPDLPVGYLGAALSAREAGQPDEESRLLSAAVERFPNDFAVATEFGSQATRARDWPESLRRWEQIKERFPDRPACYRNVAAALRHMQRLADAEAVLAEAMEHCPTEAGLAVDHAWMANHRREWPEALRRWEAIRQRFPDLLAGYTGMANVLSGLGRHDEAETLLATVVQRFPQETAPLIDFASLAQVRRNWDEAERRWRAVVTRLPQNILACRGLATALRELRRFDEAETLLVEAMQRNPSDRELVLDHVEIARRRRDWAEVMARLTAAQKRFRGDRAIQQQIFEAGLRLEDAEIAAAAGPASTVEQRKYLLFPSTPVGIGHLFTAMLNSAYYAYRTGRVLALDMRQSLYFNTNQHAAFFEHFGFEFPPELEVVTDLDEIERIGKIADRTDVSAAQPLDISRPIENTVLVVPAYTPGLPYSIDAKRPDLPFRVVLRGPLREAWERVMAMPQWAGPVIGMHFRALVGTDPGPRMSRYLVPDFAERYDAFKEAYIEKALSIAREEGYENPAFFVTSDDVEFIDYLKTRLPNSFSIATHLPAPQQSIEEHLRVQGRDLSILIDAVNDAWCLSACEHLIYSVRSGFSQFAYLNSPKLDRRRIHSMHVPVLGEILDTLEPPVAVEWALAAARKLEERRLRPEYIYIDVARAFERAGMTDDAAQARRRAEWYREAAVPPPRVTAGEEPVAIAAARRRAERSPGNPYLLAGYGDSLCEVLARHDRLDEAIAVARKALEMMPQDPYLHNQLGTLLTRSRAFDEAEQELRRAIELAPEAARLHHDLSECLKRQERWDEAIDAVRAMVALEPDEAPWHGRLGELLLLANQLGLAEAALRRAIELRGDMVPFYHMLDIVLERQQKVTEAASVLRKAQTLEPAAASWSMRLAQLLQRSGDPDGAEQAYRHVLELDPTSKAARDSLDALAASRAVSPVSATRSPMPVEQTPEVTIPNPRQPIPAPSQTSSLPQLAGRLKRWLRR